MKARKGKGIGFIVNNKGFTLIEMAIVLIIIGIIIGAVVKGKDLVRSAEQKRLYSKFLNSWDMAYNTYYDRTGWILLDVNNSDNGATAGGRDGKCSGTGGGVDDSTNLVSQLERVGLKAPSKGPTGSECVRQYTDSTGERHEFTISFLNVDAAPNHFNYIEIDSIPIELGITWDRIIDGEMDGDTGDFLYWPAGGKTDWPDVTVTNSGRAVLKVSF